jgi:acetyl-CoA carboxylase biotin carboxyl carrier protein
MNDDDRKKHENRTSTAIDPALVDALAEIAVRQELAEIEIRQDDMRIRITRHHAQTAVAVTAPAPFAATPAATPAGPVATATPVAAADHPGTIRSPMVGTVYLRPEPNAGKFVEIGGAVKQGDRIMLIEAMKTFNDILAPRAGLLTAVLVNEGEPVEFGEPLFVIE